jgi:hypothetical protein
MQQAVHRIGQLEQKSGVAVARVMAPPHGVCSAGMMAAMPGAGLEAVCVSYGSVWTGNPGADWTVSLGASPVTVVAGLPIIPRFGLDRKMENNILLAAYLNQPIIPVGHHWDLAEGPDILASAAEFINGLGNVIWSDMTSIARSNYRFTTQAESMRVQVLSRKATVQVPAGVSELRVEATWLDPMQETIEAHDIGRVVKPVIGDSPSAFSRFSVATGNKVNLAVSRNNRELPPLLPGTPFGAIARRVLVELRDRAMPRVPRRFVRK